MNRTEELIREALVRQAERRPRPDAVVAVLRRERPRRRTRAVLVTAAAAAVVAVAVPLAVQRMAVPTEGPPPDPVRATTNSPAPATGPAMRYTAGWLPDGFVERYRALGAHDMQLRSWADGPVTAEPPRFARETPYISLHVHTAGEPGWADTAQAIADAQNRATVQGHPGMFTTDLSTIAKLIWMPAPGTFLVVYLVNVPDAHQAALRVAGSVRADDGTAGVRPEIEFGVLPLGLQLISQAVLGNTPPGGITELVAGDPNRGDDGAPRVTVTLRPTDPRPSSGPTVTVRGLPGFYVAPVDQRGTESGSFTDAQIQVRLTDRRWLIVSASQIISGDERKPTPLTKEQLVSIANQLTFNQPDYQWLGA
jgi:hypothetical protein